ncbi:transporter substrate-binding domain-containing protein [Pyxidicoccus parkwayensis]|uniref:histidine kinase n=1 Tax=Pyxidicoccus parkwayensis TaxID=2813578 RepID=A0ABX7NNK0_9BACT|nr:transporter substrate-binding domain-containing protein [Pyxidicoccus parkwaysis]QSQ20016.1 transporter substrate-binding domain-containing protein [Pyxidicoccus parkwaysis]
MRRERQRRWLLLVGGGLALLGVVLAMFAWPGFSSDPLTPQERAWLESHDGKVVLGIFPESPPISFVNERGEFHGIGADYIALLEEKLGFRFHILPPRPISEVLTGVREGNVDVTEMLAPTPERSEYMDFTRPLVMIPTLIIVRRGTWDTLSLEQMRGLRIAVGERFGVHDFLAREYPQLHLVPTSSDVEGLRRLATGEVDALIADAATTSFLIERESLSNLHVAGEVPYQYELGLGVRKDSPILLGIIQKGFALITEDEKRTIRERWVFRWEHPFYEQTSFWRFVALAAGGVGLLVMGVMLWNKLLKQQVRARTAELSEANRRVSFLAEAGVSLSESLDAEKTLERLGELVVHRLADWCVIDVVRDGHVQRAAGAHVNPSKRPLLDELARRYPSHEGAPTLAGRVLRDGMPHLSTDFSDADLRASTESGEHARLVRELGARTILAVPLAIRGQTIGALTLAWGEHGRNYGAAELQLAQEVARRAAIAIDNARLYRQAQQAVRARDLFLQVAAHELRTPLTSHLLRLERSRRMLQGFEETPQKEQLAQELSMAARQARRLGTLTEQVLDVAQASSGSLELNPEEVDVCQLVQDVAKNLQEQLTACGARLELEARCPAVGWYDRLRLEAVVTNLLGNAIKFGRGQPIEVSVSSTKEGVRLSVRDHGIGLSREARGRIFEKFERAVSEQHYGGLGLGLYISRHIVESHGGVLSVESTPGEGSTFTVELPRQ